MKISLTICRAGGITPQHAHAVGSFLQGHLPDGRGHVSTSIRAVEQLGDALVIQAHDGLDLLGWPPNEKFASIIHLAVPMIQEYIRDIAFIRLDKGQPQALLHASLDAIGRDTDPMLTGIPLRVDCTGQLPTVSVSLAWIDRLVGEAMGRFDGDPSIGGPVHHPKHLFGAIESLFSVGAEGLYRVQMLATFQELT